ncbi:hypothetical protein [Pseudomonas mohnii]
MTEPGFDPWRNVETLKCFSAAIGQMRHSKGFIETALQIEKYPGECQFKALCRA